MSKNTEYADILTSVKELDKPELLTVKQDERQAQILILPSGKEAHNIKQYLDEYLTAPERRTGTATVTQLNSFIDHVNRFKDQDSALFANNNMQSPSLTAVLNYHRATSTGAPQYGDHKTHYAFPLSKEWKHWLASNGKSFSQADFAAFIEDRIGDVMAPVDGEKETDTKLKELSSLLGGNFAGPAAIMTLSRGLQINETSNVKSATNLNTGEVSIIYENEHKDVNGGPVKVPNMFFIAIPIFVAGEIYRIAVRLRYRVKSGQISWSYDLYRIEHVFEDAFEGACNKAQKETELPLFVGAPE